jgi:hypothetical protein
MAKSKIIKKKAAHVAFPDVIVTYWEGTDFMGDPVIKFKFKNGEVSEDRKEGFFKTFTEVK